MAKLKLEQRPAPRVLAVMSTFDEEFVVVFDNGSRCLIQPEREAGSRRLYAFSSHLIERGQWLARFDDIIIVANELAFEVVESRDNGRTLVTRYRGMRS